VSLKKGVKQLMEQGYDRFIEILGEMVSLKQSDESLIRDSFESVSYPKRTLLVEEGGVAGYMYFILSGYLRTYSLCSGTEVTHHINCPLGFMTAFQSYTTQRPSREYLECITSCQLLRIRKEQLEALYWQDIRWAEVGRMVNDQIIVYNEQRNRDLINLNAEERYLKLLREHPDYLQHVPLQYIASFIGIKPESLSRIRRNTWHKT